MSRRAQLVVFTAVLCAASSPARAQAPDQPDQKNDKDADAKAQKLLADAERIAGRVARLRGLAMLRPIRRGVMSKPEITRHLLDRVNKEYKPEEIASEELAMKRLGLLPPDARYLEMVIKLLTDQIAGFYDPWTQQLYIADWMTLGSDDVMAHEIDHALQDQHFKLRQWMVADKKNADASLARQALVEGDGVAVMIEFASPTPVPWGQDGFVENVAAFMSLGAATIGDMPLVIREGLMFPYLPGLRFVAELRKTRPWSAVDDVFRRPPLSSEHILHPSTYARYERPVEVRAGQASALRGRVQRYDNVLGEFGLGVLLRQHKVSLPIANIAAAGWGGDRVTMYTPPGSTDRTGESAVAVIYTVWDSEVDAVEFFGAIEDAMPSLSHGTEAARKADMIEFRAAGDAMSSVERHGDAVVVIIGAPAAAAAPLRDQVWRSWRVKRAAAGPAQPKR
jgi:hypothetical protein